MRTPEAAEVPGFPAGGSGNSAPVGGSFERLIHEARGGSKAALGELLQRCQRYLLLVANNALDSDLRPKAAASDLVQDTFVAAQQDLSHFQGTTEQELLAWLTKILTNRLANNVRHFRHTLKRDVKREVSLEAGGDPVELRASKQSAVPLESMIAHDEADRLQAALARLPAAMQELIMLRSWQRQTFVEIAVRRGGTPEAVRKAWGRAIRRLQAELEGRP